MLPLSCRQLINWTLKPSCGFSCFLSPSVYFLLYLLVEPFSWEDYLRETSSIAASPTCFKQVRVRLIFILNPFPIFVGLVSICVKTFLVSRAFRVPLCSPESPLQMNSKQGWNLKHGTPATPTPSALQRWWAWWVFACVYAWMAATTPTTSGDWSTRPRSSRLGPVRGMETCCSHRWVSVPNRFQEFPYWSKNWLLKPAFPVNGC